MKQTGRKLTSWLLTLAMLVGLLPGITLPARAADNEYKVIVWFPSSNALTGDNKTLFMASRDLCINHFSSINGSLSLMYNGVTYSDKVNVTTIESDTGNDINLAGVDLIFIGACAAVSWDTSFTTRLRDYVNKGGRVVLCGENDNAAHDGNASLSTLADQIGGNFSIDTRVGQGTPSLNPEYNSRGLLYNINADNLLSIGVAGISSSNNATWVARITQVEDKYDWIVDQPCNNKLNFPISKQPTNPHGHRHRRVNERTIDRELAVPPVQIPSIVNQKGMSGTRRG